jgi:hypothetical protein
MAKRIRFPEKSPESVLDVFEAIRRALLQRGLYRQKTSAVQPKTEKDSPDQKKQIQKKVQKKKNYAKNSKLATVAIQSHEILFKADTVFPFTLFPDTVTLDREKLSFAGRVFFKVAQITSVPVRDILSVEADIGPFFGSVHTSSRYFVTNPKSIRWLWREDAVKLQRLLQGYVIVHEQDIKTDDIPKDKLINMLNDLGTGRTG